MKALSLIHSQALKGIIDRCLALVGLTVTSPIFLTVAIVLKIRGDDVFFIEDRVGIDQKTFRIYKFTTMVKGSERNYGITMANDPRITPVGRILRRFKLNEVPQLINILKGEMSFVGPRPLTESNVEEYYSPEDRARIYSVKPGLTGRGSIEFSDEEYRLSQVDSAQEYFAEVIMPKKAELEIWYVDNWNIILDLKLFFKTIFKLSKEVVQYLDVHYRR